MLCFTNHVDFFYSYPLNCTYGFEYGILCIFLNVVWKPAIRIILIIIVIIIISISIIMSGVAVIGQRCRASDRESVSGSASGRKYRLTFVPFEGRKTEALGAPQSDEVLRGIGASSLTNEVPGGM